MNFSSISGFAIAGAIIWYGVIQTAARPTIFVDKHALILVLGGTLAAALIAFPLRRFRDLIEFLFDGIFNSSQKKDVTVIEQILLLSVLAKSADLDVEERILLHPFLAEGYLIGKQMEMTTPEFKLLIQSRRQRIKERYALNAKLIVSLAKFPPAFGLIGATTGMIAMMSGLGTGGSESIGPSMAIALVATFWGIALSNFILLPLADHAQRIIEEGDKHRQMIATGLTLIHAQCRPRVILEHLVGFIPITEQAVVRRNLERILARHKANVRDIPGRDAQASDQILPDTGSE